MSFNKVLLEKKQIIEDYIKELSLTFKDIPKVLKDSMEYSLLNGGKRIRPILFLETFKLFNNEEVEKQAINLACAIECIHLYTLIHDDLPCMDDDDFRRGQPSNHKKFGEGIAVLAGDALLNLAYELMFEAIKLSNYSHNYVKACAQISEKIGAFGLIAGQALDITLKKEEAPSQLTYIYRHKTGDLIVASMVAGAIAGGASKKDIENIKEFAYNFAYSFQIKDDILDYEDKTDENEVTFVNIYGINQAKLALGDSVNRAIVAIDKISKDTSFFKLLAKKSIDRKE